MTISFEIVNVDDVVIDSTMRGISQRIEGVDERRCQGMAKTFNPAMLGTITLYRRKDGTLVVGDGAHRVTTCRIVGFKKIPALIHSDLTVEQEAALFNGLNNFKQPSAISRFLARAASGDAVAVAIKKTVEDHGWQIALSSSNGYIACVDALDRAYRSDKKGKGGTDAIDWALDILTAAWEYDNKSASSHHLLALTMLHNRFGGQINGKKLVTELQKTRPTVVLGLAKNLRDSQGGTVPAAMAKVLVGLHNKKLRANLLPEWVWTR